MLLPRSKSHPCQHPETNPVPRFMIVSYPRYQMNHDARQKHYKNKNMPEQPKESKKEVKKRKKERKRNRDQGGQIEKQILGWKILIPCIRG